MRGQTQEGLYGILNSARHAPAADTAAVVTLAALADEHHVIRQIDCSYIGGVPAAAGLTVTIGGTTVWSVDLPRLNNQAPYHFEFHWGLYDSASTVNQEVVITATDPGEASTVATLNVLYE